MKSFALRNYCLLTPALSALGLLMVGECVSAEVGRWPMWRADAARSATVGDAMPAQLRVQWERQLPVLQPAFRNGRLQFDAHYQPLIADRLVVIGSSADDTVTAYDVQTGAVRWRFTCDGPVRCAPVIWKDRLFFGADDGFLYTLNLQLGTLVRKQRLAVGPRMLLGNGRLISVWPVRGGPVVHDGKLYVACGVWPSEGVFVYCYDAATGELIWHNDRLGYLFGGHPHNAEAFGGVAPQGYLLVDGDALLVPCSTAYPAKLNRHTGELIEFQLPLAGRKPGGWYASKDVRRGVVEFDRDVNRQDHEDGPREEGTTKGVQRQLTCAGKVHSFDAPLPGVKGKVVAMALARESLVVATASGRIYCLNPEFNEAPRQWPVTADPSDSAEGGGYGLIIGASAASHAASLPAMTALNWVAIESQGDRAEALRRQWRSEGRRANRRALVNRRLDDLDLPPYFATQMVIAAGEWEANFGRNAAMLLRCLRPFGGQLLALDTNRDRHLEWQMIAAASQEAVFEVRRDGDSTLIVKTGALRGTADYLGNWQTTNDALVQAPLGVLWFDDELAHFKRSPQPSIQSGVMVSYPKDWHASRKNIPKGTDYPLLSPIFSDIYTGRVLPPEETSRLAARFPKAEPQKREPTQYRPPHQKNDWSPQPPNAGTRTNPLTGHDEPRVFPKSYGCDGGVDYGYLYSMRSGTAAFYDKTLESGTICVSGPRSGCTNSIIPAGGVLNVPYFYEGCTCSYPLPSGLALVRLPEIYEQWATWGDGAATDIQRVGVNFGAPGDRMTRDGTLWLDWPSVGGASPDVQVSVKGDKLDYRYQHSSRVEGGVGWPWVAASEVVGAAEVTIRGVRAGRYVVRCYLCGINRTASERKQPSTEANETAITIEIDGQSRSLVLQESSQVVSIEDVMVDGGKLVIGLSAAQGATRLSGVEVIRSGLAPGELIRLGGAKASKGKEGKESKERKEGKGGKGGAKAHNP